MDYEEEDQLASAELIEGEADLPVDKEIIKQLRRASDPQLEWLEAAALLVGNIGHESRNNLRFVACLIRGEDMDPIFKAIDKTSGQVEGIMRKVISRTRHRRVRPLFRLISAAQQSVRSMLVDAQGARILSRNSTQQAAMEHLIELQSEWLTRMSDAIVTGFAHIDAIPELDQTLDFSM